MAFLHHDVFALVFFLLGCSPLSAAEHQSSRPPTSVASAPPKTEGRLTRIIPKSNWEPIYFETINQHAKLSNLPSLRKNPLPENDLEVRIWEGFGRVMLQGVVLRRTRGQWSAIRLLPASKRYDAQRYQRILPPPKSGWEPLWKKLMDAGLLTLPDDSTLKPDGVNVADGTSYVVEYNKDSTYRTYQYDNPDYHPRWPEAKKMLQIRKILGDAFDLSRKEPRRKQSGAPADTRE